MAGFSFVPLWPVIGSRLQKMSASSFISFASIPVAIDSLPGMAPAQTAPRSVPALLRRFLAAPILTVLDLAGQTTRSQSTRRQRRRPEDAPAHRPREHHRSQPDRCSETELYEVTCHQVKHTTRGSSRVINRTARQFFPTMCSCVLRVSLRTRPRTPDRVLCFQKAQPATRPNPPRAKPTNACWVEATALRRRESLGGVPHVDGAPFLSSRGRTRARTRDRTKP